MATSDPLEKRLSMNVEGHILDIITEEVSEGEWSLCVVNCHGIRSEWFEFFSSAEAALKEGQRAILEEGVDPFISIEGFEYLA